MPGSTTSVAAVDEPRVQERAWHVVRLYYVVMLALALAQFGERSADSLVPGHALWPVAWAPLGAAGVTVIRLLMVLGPLAAALHPRARWCRVLAWAGYLEFGAFLNSFGKINHSLHLWVSTAFILIFLGAPAKSERGAREDVAALRYAQIFVLMTYTMAGVAKLIQAVHQWSQGDRYWLFSPEALAIQVARQHFDTGRLTAFGRWLLEHPPLGSGLMLFAAALEVFSLPVAARRGWYAGWGALLIGMHAGILLAMDLDFTPAMLLVAVLLVCSPFTDTWGSRLAAQGGAFFDRCVWTLSHWRTANAPRRAGGETP